MIVKLIKQNGFSMIEVIVAIVIIVIGLVGIMSLNVQNIQVQYINKNILVASLLAQEGLELVRNIRDENWLTAGYTWSRDIVNDGTYIIDYNGRSSINSSVNNINENGARLYLNNSFYSHTGTSQTNFYRLITVVNNTNYLDVECKIRWEERGQNHYYTAKTYLYNWR